MQIRMPGRRAGSLVDLPKSGARCSPSAFLGQGQLPDAGPLCLGRSPALRSRISLYHVHRAVRVAKATGVLKKHARYLAALGRFSDSTICSHQSSRVTGCEPNFKGQPRLTVSSTVRQIVVGRTQRTQTVPHLAGSIHVQEILRRGRDGNVTAKGRHPSRRWPVADESS